VTWDGVLRLRGKTLAELADAHGGIVVRGAERAPKSLASVERAGEHDLAPLLSRRFVGAALEAIERGAAILVDASLGSAVSHAPAVWKHDYASWALAELLEQVAVPDEKASWGSGCSIAPSAVLGPRVVLGARVVVGPGAVVGHPGFGWARGPEGAVRPVRQLAGVFIEDDVSLGPLCSVDAGTLAPTRVGRGAKLDAHVHVAHNVEIGQDCMIAAQCGFAGSVKMGRRVLVGGQVGIADHVVVGDDARIAAKSGVIGDVREGAIVAGYPAVPRKRWLRALAKLYSLVGGSE
jgi:UDP-3-O-[3-hydroxymyristoyl] glucosamine N-acyltransferase